MLKNFSFDWYRKAGRVNQSRTYIRIGTAYGGISTARRLLVTDRKYATRMAPEGGFGVFRNNYWTMIGP